MKSRRAVIKGAGEICKECGKTMNRMVHPDGWIPTDKQTYYFTEWDYCFKCKKIMQYESFKRTK